MKHKTWIFEETPGYGFPYDESEWALTLSSSNITKKYIQIVYIA